MNQKDIDEFIHAYKVAALWSSNDNADPETGGEPLDSNYDVDDIDEETDKKMRQDCVAFLKAASSIIEDCVPRNGGYTVWDLAGHDFWLTRNGHGTGFWDYGRWLTEDGTSRGDELDRIAKRFRQVDLYVGDDGKIHQD